MRGEYGDSDHPYSFSSRVWWRWDGCIGYVFEYANMKAGFGQGGLSFSGGEGLHWRYVNSVVTGMRWEGAMNMDTSLQAGYPTRPTPLHWLSKK